MAITSASFVKSINGTDGILYDSRFQVAFVGRSNVGKSSVINSLVGKKLARSSKTPGKTKRLDFFLINNKIYFVDLPGYGFAHASAETKEHYRKLMMWYFEYADVKKRMVVHIIDSVVGCMDFDRQMTEYLDSLHIPHIILANKKDKLSKHDQKKHLEDIRHACGSVPVIAYSAKTNEGKNEVLTTIFHMAKV